MSVYTVSIKFKCSSVLFIKRHKRYINIAHAHSFTFSVLLYTHLPFPLWVALYTNFAFSVWQLHAIHNEWISVFLLETFVANNMSSSSLGWIQIRDEYRFTPSQWETSLQSNAVSHWLGANLQSALQTPVMSGFLLIPVTKKWNIFYTARD